MTNFSVSTPAQIQLDFTKTDPPRLRTSMDQFAEMSTLEAGKCGINSELINFNSVHFAFSPFPRSILCIPLDAFCYAPLQRSQLLGDFFFASPCPYLSKATLPKNHYFWIFYKGIFKTFDSRIDSKFLFCNIFILFIIEEYL